MAGCLAGWRLREQPLLRVHTLLKADLLTLYYNLNRKLILSLQSLQQPDLLPGLASLASCLAGWPLHEKPSLRVHPHVSQARFA